MPVSLNGTLSRFNSIPHLPLNVAEPPLIPISVAELVRPAAPISCAAITYPVSASSKQASINNFSRYGSPT